MKNLAAWLLLLMLPQLAWAGTFRSFTLAQDESSLTIVRSDGSQLNAPRYPDQVGFSQPRISGDGKHIGWLALHPNCCTSYPIPLALVVMDESLQLHTFDGIKLAVFEWCFPSRSATDVAFMQTTVHGTNFEYFERRSIADGRLLSTYEYPHEDADNARARKRAPQWVRCVSHN